MNSFPMIGKRSVKVSNHWNFFNVIFQSLENVLNVPPALRAGGSRPSVICENRCNRWTMNLSSGGRDEVAPEVE